MTADRICMNNPNELVNMTDAELARYIDQRPDGMERLLAAIKQREIDEDQEPERFDGMS